MRHPARSILSLMLCFLFSSCQIEADYVFLITDNTVSSPTAFPDETEITSINTVSNSETTPKATEDTTLPSSPSDPEYSTSIPAVTEPKTTEIPETESTETPSTTTAPPDTPPPAETAPPIITPPETKPSAPEPPVTAPPNNTGALILVSLTETVARGKNASLSIRGTPGVSYIIEVYYSSTVSTAKGLEPQVADANGTVTWIWKVGTRTKPGPHKIVIRGNGETLTLSFTTTE